MLEKTGAKGDEGSHAYLITAYNNFPVLEALIRMLDDSRNEIFIHVDRRVRSFDFQHFARLSQSARVIFVRRVRVHWGHYSQIRSVFNLFGEATRTYHSHYHLLSGADLPIKSQDYIHDFCDQHGGKQFVGFGRGEFRSRLRLFHILNCFRRPVNRHEQPIALIFAFAERVSFRFQSFLGLDRTKLLNEDIKKGSDWFSLTHQAALYLLANRKKIRRLFRFTDIPTEFYVQTLLWNSPFRNQIFDPEDEFRSSLRHVDWARGSPYVFRGVDLPELLESPALFARKFDADIDIGIVHDVMDAVSRSE